MSYNILYIEDENAKSIKTDIESNGINVTVLQPSGFENDLADIYKLGYDAYLMDFRLTSGKGKVDAPTFATTLRTDGDNQRKVPIIMISTEKKLPLFENDFTSQDLFDVVIGKGAFRREHQKYTNRLKSLIDAYRTVQTSNFNILSVLQIENRDQLDYRLVSLLDKFASRKDVYGFLRTISNSLIRAIGPLVGPDVLASRLGIDKTCSDLQKLLSTPEFERCKYIGVLSQTYERWWFDKIQQLWGTLTNSSMRRTTAQVRVDILNKKFGLNLKAAIPLAMATSSTFWTICHESKNPLDPSDGFQYRNRHIDEWLEPEYISLIAALEHPAQQEYLSPRDKEEVRFLGSQANEK